MAAEAVCKYGVSALVTGAGRGIGLELCRLLTEAGCNVYATVRKESEVSTARDPGRVCVCKSLHVLSGVVGLRCVARHGPWAACGVHDTSGAACARGRP